MRRLVAWLAGAVLLTGCASPGPESERRATTDPGSLAATQTLDGVRLSDAGWPSAQWWRALGDPQLDALIERALAGNPGIAVAQARLARARAAALSAESALRPDAVAGLDMTHQRFSEAGLIPPPLGGSWRSQNRLAVDISWDLDLWGRNRSLLQGALGQLKAAEVDTFATRLALATAIARAYVEFDRLHAQADVARATLKQRTAILELTAKRVDAGIDTNVELRQAEAAVPAARAEVTALEEGVALARNQLAALAGQGPDGGLALNRPALGAATALALPSTLPADLLGRRPDLVAQRWRVEAASSDIDAARARFHPNVNLIGFIGLSSVGLPDFLSSAAAIAGIGPAVRLPLFDGGRLRADLAGRRADYDIAVEQYNLTLVEAIREIADQVVSIRSVGPRRADQALALDRYRKAYELAVLRYREGLGTYLAVLAAEGQVLAQSRAEADLRARELDLSIGLVRALGGGYAVEPAAGAAAAVSGAGR
jgi:NodT family efflux transporter outer membrane factor (OMF) lipoprotein